jgi:hypothetical protein
MSGGKLNKAVFRPVGPCAPLTVQYNPVNFKFDKSVSWKEHSEQGQEGSLEFQTNSPASMSCELHFDTTKDGADVRLVWVNKLLAMTNPDVVVGGEQGMKRRPPKINFLWGEFKLLGVIESLSVTYLMFSTNGTPLRAKVAVKMKEWGAEKYYGEGEGTSYAPAPVKFVTAKAGDTVSTVAAREGVDFREICALNNLPDPGHEFAAGDKIMTSSKK